MLPDAAVTISRPSRRFVDRPMTYTVWLDGQDVGAIHNGETRRFPISPGVHKVRLGISGRALGSGRIWISQDKEVEASTGDAAALRCTPRPMRGIFRPHHRIELEEASTAQ